MSTFVLCRVVAESRGVVRKREVVVDGLWTVDVGDRVVLCCQELGNPVGSGSGIVTTYGHKKLDVVLLEELKIEILLEILVGRLETAHLKI